MQEKLASWKDVDPHKTTMEEVYKKYSLDDHTSDFVGHALALFRDDEYKSKPCLEAMKRKLLIIRAINKIFSPEVWKGMGYFCQCVSKLILQYN